MNKLTHCKGLPFKIKEGRPIELEDGRIVRFSREKQDFEIFINGEWVSTEEKIYWKDVVEVTMPPHWD